MMEYELCEYNINNNNSIYKNRMKEYLTILKYE